MESEIWNMMWFSPKNEIHKEGVKYIFHRYYAEYSQFSRDVPDVNDKIYKPLCDTVKLFPFW